MAENVLYASFMVRLWREAAGEANNEEAPVWKGEIESIQTGCTWQFQGLEPLLPLLAAQLPAIPYPGPEIVDSS